MSRRVGIVGAAVTPFKATWREKTYYELAQMATREAVKDAGIPIQDVDAVFYGIYNDIFRTDRHSRACAPRTGRDAEQIRYPYQHRRSDRGLYNFRGPCLPGCRSIQDSPGARAWKSAPTALIFHQCPRHLKSSNPSAGQATVSSSSQSVGPRRIATRKWC